MNSVDSLIREIQEHESVEIDGSLSEDSRKRIEEKIMQAILKEEVPVRKKKGRKAWLILTLAAVLVLALGLSVGAVKEKEWDIALINFMGISNANTFQLENGMVEIYQGEKSLCMDYGQISSGVEKEVEMQAVHSIGDKNEAYIRIETDYVLPEDFDPTTDYILPEDYSLSVSPNKSGYGSVFTYCAEDNKLGFLLEISNCQDINTAEISVVLKNLYLYHDLQEEGPCAEKELLCVGSWELNWSYHYESHTETKHMLHALQIGGINYYLTKVEVSPLSVRVEAFRMPWNREEECADLKVEEIHFADGTVLEIEDLSGAGVKNSMLFEFYVGADKLGQIIDPKQVSALVIAGEKISLK